MDEAAGFGLGLSITNAIATAHGRARCRCTTGSRMDWWFGYDSVRQQSERSAA